MPGFIDDIRILLYFFIGFIVVFVLAFWIGFEHLACGVLIGVLLMLLLIWIIGGGKHENRQNGQGRGNV